MEKFRLEAYHLIHLNHSCSHNILQAYDCFFFCLFVSLFQRSLGDLQITNTIEVPEIKSLGPLLHTKNSVSAEKVLAIDDKTLQIK